MNNTSNFELVEELVKRTNISYAEAKETLETCDWNMTEAMILLEKQGKIGTGSAQQKCCGFASDETKEKIKQTAESCASDIKNVVHKGNTNYVEMMNDGKVVFSIPVTAAVAIGVIGCNLVIPAAVVALLCGCSFHIKKPDNGVVSTAFTNYQPWTNTNTSSQTAGNEASDINLEK
jgi:hypothetical protein